MANKFVSDEVTRMVDNAIDVQENTIDPDMPFWCYHPVNYDRDGLCCWWHRVFWPNAGPERDDIYHPCYHYEQDLLKSLEKHKKIAYYKATGLGISEFMLLWILWKCFTDRHFQDGAEAVIVTGPNVDLAKNLIDRARSFLINADLPFVDHGVYELKVNGGRIKAYPSNNIHSARSLPRVSIFFGDEAAFFSKQSDDGPVRIVGERYIGKSNSWVVWCSTAGESTNGFFYDILQDPNTEYDVIERYAEWGLKKDPETKTSIFNPKFIEEAKKSRSYEREYLGIWGHNVGDVFTEEDIANAFSKEFTFTLDGTHKTVMGIDPAFGSSYFGIVIVQQYKDKYRVIFARQYERMGYIDMINEINKIASTYKVKRLYVDGSWPEGIRDLQNKYHYYVTGIPWNQYGQKMLDNVANQFAQGKVEILPHLKELKIQLSTISLDVDGKPNKKKVSFDLGDALLLALWFFKQGSGQLLALN